MQGRLENLLGAFTVALADQVHAATDSVVGGGPSAAAALVALLRRPHQSIESLRRPLRLSHSATVRLVDRLEQEELVARRAAPDGRAVALVLTAKGRRRALRIQERRRAVLNRAIAGLSGADRRSLEALLVRLLRSQGLQLDDPMPVCRLCEVSVCPVRRCPIPSAR